MKTKKILYLKDPDGDEGIIKPGMVGEADARSAAALIEAGIATDDAAQIEAAEAASEAAFASTSQ